ncbi:hypothetical protein [Xanthobacter sp. 126]|uniref:hypothetical protein n=1 Tax=Xanthobacter sp. 126 TaxID=1131814 RepID=UPI0012DDD85C|nr:hypothetical protein [Xanthobacter sp. 126]
MAKRLVAQSSADAIRAKYPDYSTFEVLTIVYAIVALSEAYRAIRNSEQGSDGFMRQLDKIQDMLSGISSKLSDISNRIAQIENILINLPLVIRGELKGNTLATLFGEANSICQRLHDNLDPRYINDSIPDIKRDSDRLHDIIGSIRGVDGVTGLFTTAPLASLWLTARVAIEKVKSQQSTYVPRSPWAESFMTDSHARFVSAYSLIRRQDVEYNTQIIPHFPKYNSRQNVTTKGIRNIFVPAPKIPKIGPNHPKVYSVTQTLQGEFLEVEYVLTDFPNPPTNAWKRVNLNMPAKGEESGRDAYQTFVTDRRESIAFYDCVPSLYSNEADLMSSFVEPPDFWVRKLK